MKMDYKLNVTRTLLHGAANKFGLTGINSPQKPVILEFMITSKCDCHCVMCNIWKKDPQNDLSLDEIRTMLLDPVLSDLRTMTLSGGEPFQRDDILDLCQIINEKSKNLIQLYLSTNGFDYEGIANKITSILKIMVNIKRLRIAVSFDHIHDHHDKIRGKKGIHNNALILVQKLKNIGDPRLTIQGNFTIAPYNVNNLNEIYEYFKKLNLNIFWFPIMVSDNFFENEEKAEKFAFSQKERALLNDFVAFLRLHELSMPDYYYYTGLLNSLNRGARAFPCSGGSKFLLVNAIGDVYPCYIIPKSYRMGSIRKNTLQEIWYSEEARRIRKLICSNATCNRCIQWYDGYALSHSLKIFSGFVLAHPVRLIKHFLRF